MANFKGALRKAATRTVEALENAIADAFGASTLDECTNYFLAEGYVSP